MFASHALTVLGILLVLLLLFFFGERFLLNRRLGRIKTRIAITGTRGKSSVTRLVAGALRESGLRVLAKTTGSAARIILPDGSEFDIPRSGLPTILENKLLVRLARRHRAEALVCEMMSISPECLRVESGRLLRPGILLITNVRLDHREEQGSTREDIARSLSGAIGPGGIVFVPESDYFPIFEERAALVKAQIIRVPGASGEFPEGDHALDHVEFAENISLALAVSDHLGIPRPAALRGMSKSRPDLGHLKAVRASLGEPPSTWTLVSAFAANEPESTQRIMDKVREAHPFSVGRLRAVLNLREDREDRTLQWLDALRDGFFKEFDAVAFVGSPATPALKRKMRSLAGGSNVPPHLIVLSGKSPEKITGAVSSALGRGAKVEGGLIIGLGNMRGLGVRLMDYWDRIGERTGHGLG